ncbi:hypothetical protein BK816_08520 [Boudabousia tangfeifanii]|uniref:Uncharacterized protein n=1 Tax=Boudabousia tangfeifanii TaxID=1912795 RepID=A0A1D9MM06_9ACTO|nr:hypothetical protein [Boudabousia tangfeifanii]AOZ73315.1 hypothetical protein BK816_08520 [Boudabousia tangfeifanii]
MAVSLSKKYNKDFIKDLSTAAKGTETEVIANTYRCAISRAMTPNENPQAPWDFECKTDGFFSPDHLFYNARILFEAKDDLELRSARGRATIVIQCIFYMKQYDQVGHEQPTILMGADRNQAFLVYAPPFMEYLERDDVDWNVAPSNAAKKHPDLLKEIEEHDGIKTYVFDIRDENFDVNEIIKAIENLAKNEGSFKKIKISNHNIRAVFDEFITMLDLSKNSKMDSRQRVELFILSILGSREVWIDDAVGNLIHLRDKAFTIDTGQYQSFFGRYSKKYSDVEKDSINAMYDVLFEEAERRKSGDFWTPTIWADKAHEMLSDVLGQDWRRTRVVWDPACGTKNLTRDYTDWQALYLSTIFDEELSTSRSYNKDAVTFQFDFLNDDVSIDPKALFGVEWKMPPSLYREFLEDKPFVFLMNPPFGTAANHDSENKASIAKNPINEDMKRCGLDKAAQQLYAQFLWRIVKFTEVFNLSDVTIGFFSNDRFMFGGKTWEKFMAAFQDKFKFEKGIVFNAGEFSDVSRNWGISFTVWRWHRDTGSSLSRTGLLDSYEVEYVEATTNGLRSLLNKKIIPASASHDLKQWVKKALPKPTVNLPEGSFVRVSGPLKLYSSKNKGATYQEEAVGYLHCNANSVEHSDKYTGLYSTCFGSGHGLPVFESSMERSAVYFATRKTSIPPADKMWIYGHESYREPTSEIFKSLEWEEFVVDCLVFSLCAKGSNQSAMRNIEVAENRLVNVSNPWFFASIKNVEELATAANQADVIRDIKTNANSESAWFRLASGKTFSAEASAVYDALMDLLIHTMNYRGDMNRIDGTVHANAWDAGYRQLSLIDQKFSSGSNLIKLKEAMKVLSQKINDRAIKWELHNVDLSYGATVGG